MCKTEHDGMSNITVHLDKIYLNYQWRNKDYRGYEHGLWNHYLLQFGPLDVHVNSPLPFFYKMGTIRLRTLYFILQEVLYTMAELSTQYLLLMLDNKATTSLSGLVSVQSKNLLKTSEVCSPWKIYNYKKISMVGKAITVVSYLSYWCPIKFT